MPIDTITPFPFRVGPVTNISPVTYRDAETFLSQLETLKTWIADYVIPGLNNGYTQIIEEVNEGIANAEATVLEAKAGWETVFNAYMEDVNASLMALNDHAMSTLIELPASETAVSLTKEYTKKSLARVVYVDPVNGLDTNGGGAVAPLKTISKAIDIAETLAMVADATFTINLVAGTYTERVTAAEFTPFALNIVIQGPEIGHPAVPLVTFTEGVNTSAAAFKFNNPNAIVTIKYVKGLGYNGSSSSAFINSAQGVINTVNVHAEKCFYGISSVRGQLDVKGGVLTNNGRLENGSGTGAAIRSLMLNRHSIGTQSAGNLAQGPTFTLNRYGFFAQESSTGHVDYCTFTDNESAVVLRANSRANVDGSSFERNLTDIACDGNTHVFISENVAFGSGANKSGDTVRLMGGAEVTTGRAVTGEDLAYSRTERVAAGNYSTQTVTGTTNATNVMNYNLRAPWWNDTRRVSGTPVKRVRVKAVGTLSGGAGTIQLTFRLGGKTSPLTFGAAETGSFVWEGEVIFPEPGRQIITSRALRNLADTPRSNVSEGAIDMSVDQTLILQATLANAADSVSFSYVELIHA